jgi:CMP-2-keto-3-deoxyoctulosonic acid synthetase
MAHSKRMKILGVIPARYHSTRLEGKALLDICGKPMIQRVYERAKLAPSLSRVLVATDDERILRAVSAHLVRERLPAGRRRRRGRRRPLRTRAPSGS